MKPDPKLRNDRAGLGAIWTALTLLVIILIVWEIGGSYLNVMTPSEYFTGEPTQIEWNSWTKDRVTGVLEEQTTLPIVRTHQLEAGHTYQFKFITNAPYKWNGDQYHVVWNMELYNYTTTSYDFLYGARWNMPWTSLWDNTFLIDLPITETVLKNYRLEVFFYSPLGAELEHHKWFFNEVLP